MKQIHKTFYRLSAKVFKINNISVKGKPFLEPRNLLGGGCFQLKVSIAKLVLKINS
jgi:hypothetical protein